MLNINNGSNYDAELRGEPTPTARSCLSRRKARVQQSGAQGSIGFLEGNCREMVALVVKELLKLQWFVDHIKNGGVLPIVMGWDFSDVAGRKRRAWLRNRAVEGPNPYPYPPPWQV